MEKATDKVCSAENDIQLDFLPLNIDPSLFYDPEHQKVIEPVEPEQKLCGLCKIVCGEG